MNPFGMMEITVAGLRLIVVPDSCEVRRGWLERLFSRPWTPLTATKVVPTHWPQTLGDSVLVSKAEGCIFAREHVALEIRKRGREFVLDRKREPEDPNSGSALARLLTPREPTSRG